MRDKVLDIDLKSIFFGMREVLPHMIKRKYGSTVNLASIWGLAGVPNVRPYQAAKGAILNVSKNVAATHARAGRHRLQLATPRLHRYPNEQGPRAGY